MLVIAKNEDYGTFMVRVRQAYQRMKSGVDVETDIIARRKIRDQFFTGCRIPDWVSRGLRGCENLREVVRYVTEDMDKQKEREEQNKATWRQRVPAGQAPQLPNVRVPPPMPQPQPQNPPMVGVVQRGRFNPAPPGAVRAPTGFAGGGRMWCYQCRQINLHWPPQCQFLKYCSICKLESHNDVEHRGLFGGGGGGAGAGGEGTD